MIGALFNMAIKSLFVCPKTNGIYKITNIDTGQFYIGRAEGKRGFLQRWYGHRLALRKNIHDNIYLQNAYNKYGESCFTFEILEIRPYGEDLFDLESEYIVNLKAMYFEGGYNLANKRFVAKYPKIDRINHHGSKEFELLDPEGNLIKGKNLTQFCEELGLRMGSMFKVITGEATSYKGYKSPNPDFHPIKREYRLLSPEKELIIFDNVSEFARKIGADFSSVWAIFRRTTAHIKGYHLENPTPEHQKHIDRFLNKFFLINEDLGIIVKFLAIRTFSRKYNVPFRPLYSFLTGEPNRLTKNYNWRTPTEDEMYLYPIIKEDF